MTLPRALAALALALVPGLAVPSPISAAAADEPKPVRVLLIGHAPDHPPGTHLYMHESELLAKCLAKIPGVEPIVSNGWPTDPKTLEGVATIVFYTSPAANILYRPEIRSEAERLMAEGVGLVTLHWATGGELRDIEAWLRHSGAIFNMAFCGLEVRDTVAKRLAPDHPISRGWTDFPLRDEIYLRVAISNKSTPLIKVKTNDGEQIVAWAIERENANGGRSFGSTLGHFHEVFANDAFRKMVVNAILWTARVEIPEEGADVALPAEELATPK